MDINAFYNYYKDIKDDTAQKLCITCPFCPCEKQTEKEGKWGHLGLFNFCLP